MRKFWQGKGLTRRGVLALCLAFVLTLSLLPQAFGIRDGATETSPSLTIAAVGVEDTYLELGLNIRALTNGFRSVGAVVTYNPTLLTPVDWSDEPVQPGTDTFNNVETARTVWNTIATPLETKGPDELSGKTALVFEDGSAGYLYLSAESPRLIPGGTEDDDGNITGGWNQPLPEVAPATDAETASAISTNNGIEVVAPVTSPVAEPIDQSVVVRFQLKDGATMQAALASIDLAIDDVAEGAPINDNSGVAYFHNDKGDSLPANVQILRAEVGTTYFTGGVGGGGGSSTEGIIPITFFDWDGELLATEIVASTGDLESQTAAVQAVLDKFEFANLPEGYAKSEATGLYSKPPENAGETEEWNREGFILSEKTGYSFGCWVPYDSETPTVYGNYVNTLNVNNMATTPLAKPADAMGGAEIAQSIIDGAASFTLKAVYVDNVNCVMTDATSRMYTVTIDDISRFVATGWNFPVRVKIVRGNVPRAVQPALRVATTVGEVTTYSIYDLKGADTEYVTVSLYANVNGNVVKSADFALVDRYGADNWPGAGERNDTKLVTLEGNPIESGPMGATRDTDYFAAGSFGRDGIIGSFNECFELYAAAGETSMGSIMGRINQNPLRNAGIYYTTSIMSLTNVRSNLYKAWKKQNTIDGTDSGPLKPSDQYVDLTWDQIYEVIHGVPFGS